MEQLYQIFRQHPRITTDSRQVQPGDLFFALRGDTFDGNQFAAQALEKGAAFAVVDRPEVATTPQYLLVQDTLTALQQLALHHRRRFHIPVIAVCGSNGKTTTKDLLSSILEGHYPTHYTRGNFNNHIGVPLTILAMPERTEVAVLEIGANRQGEIDFLCHIAEPTHGLITNIGKEHLEGFGGLEGVKQGESELYRFLAAHHGMAFINRDEPFLKELAEPLNKKLFYGLSDNLSDNGSWYGVQLLATQPFVKVAFRSERDAIVEVQSNLVGKYNFANIMTAIVLGLYFKVPAHKIKSAIETWQPQHNRSQLLHRGSNTFLMDAYNANPSSMEQAIISFADMDTNGQKIAILGDMLELGDATPTEHDYIAQLAVQQHFTQTVLVGKAFALSAQRYGLLHFQNVDTLRAWFEEQDFTDTAFLLKGSRGIGLERMLVAATAH
ncbi:MAG TPA: UDP-N-acetylmuramoyl-tripeptide--D-alanyl-D-alanine ligase [Saprospiraceae bacterium]|nr:UDP-N-acetylmuramoyl-tripeptide--D-alanyl-D-alanine ligase [Saprospiraceae bacterium]HMP13784.1 UDP-N-acetylmuramoyl-tripeptide--D-alanyl-D-alanine ligase [Saprospiraceae bacterium]